MIEFEVVYFLAKSLLSYYLATYYREATIFILILSVLHFVARIAKARRGVV